MARLLRIYFPGAIYHVTGRMLGSWKSERNLLFRDDKDRERFLVRLEQSVIDFEVRLFAFCLMSNHFHLLVETPKGNLSKFMQSLNTGYTVYFNRRHQRHGHLLDGRFKSEVVAGDSYLLKLSRYIHLNPVEVSSWKRRSIKEKSAHLRSYRWSSYPYYIRKTKTMGFLETGPLKALTKIYGRGGAKGFRDYVEHGLANSDTELKELLKQSSKGIGDLDFRLKIETLRNKLTKQHNKPEDVAFRRSVNNLSSEFILSEVAQFYKVPVNELIKKQRGSYLRPITARMLFRFGGYTQREIAKMLGLTTGASDRQFPARTCIGEDESDQYEKFTRFHG
jgi:putative transposase